MLHRYTPPDCLNNPYAAAILALVSDLPVSIAASCCHNRYNITLPVISVSAAASGLAADIAARV